MAILKKDILEATENYVRSEFSYDVTGHDWFHVDRVRRNAFDIWKNEQAGDPFIIEMAALLHDIPDEKLNTTAETGRDKLHTYLQSTMLEAEDIHRIEEVIESISFKGGNGVTVSSIEARIVQDADRLDALGAVGIARTFAYGGSKGQPIYDPHLSVRETMSAMEYRTGQSSSIHHFYEKLLKLKDILNTESARKMAEKRHQFMEVYLEEFYKEWNGQS